MPLFAAAAGGALGAVLDSWKMSFQTIHFLLFLPIVVGGYFVLPGRARRAWLLLASYYFYFFAAPKYLPVLLLGTLFSYLFGRFIAAAKPGKGRGWLLFLGVLGCVGALAFFKYSRLLAPLFARFGLGFNSALFTTAAAVGISYYTFTSIGYLVDVYRGDVPAEKNILTYALFLGFFPSIVSGPINRASALIPQLTDTTRRFDAQNAADALREMAIGFFKKMAVADTLSVFVGAVYKNPQAYTGLTLTLASIGFALQLYFDFSGYTDIALATAKLLGIRLPPNFNNPHFSTNFSGFWSRWHISLSTWLQEYIFTPLVWSRWPEKLPLIGKLFNKPPVLSSLAIVFLVSGIWHGDTLCFVVWGALQAVFRIGEELLHRFVGKPKKRPPLWSRIGKNAVVLVLWVESLVFFGIGMMNPFGDPARGIAGGVRAAVSMLGRQFLSFSPAQAARDIYNTVFAGVFAHRGFVFLFLAFSLVCLGLALWADWAQCFKLKGKSLVTGMQAMPTALRWVTYYFVVLACFAGFLLQNNASFLYGGF